MTVTPMARAWITELCHLLGHEPERVARITVEPDRVTVEYVHPVTEP